MGDLPVLLAGVIGREQAIVDAVADFLQAVLVKRSSSQTSLASSYELTKTMLWLRKVRRKMGPVKLLL